MNDKYIKDAKIKEGQNDLRGAIKLYKDALEENPRNNSLQIEIGNLLAALGDFEEAAGFFRRANRFFPNNIDIKSALGFCLCSIGNKYQLDRRYNLAEAAFEESLKFEPGNADFIFNLGNALFSQNKLREALKSYQKSIQINEDANTYTNLANTYRRLNDLTKAKQNYIKALKINPDLIHTKIELTHLMQGTCDWNGIDDYFGEIKKHILNKKPGKISPFAVLSMPGLSSEDHLHVSTNWSEQKKINPMKPVQRVFKKNITIGYLSADFRNHPLYYLIYDVLNNHDVNKFTIKLFYSGQREDSDQYKNFVSINEELIDISNLNDEQSAKIISDEGVDILVDLSGFTKNTRSMAAAYRPAKIHINWLGFAGTMGFHYGKPLFDFILADKYVVPKSHSKNYAEKIIYLPNCYQPNIANRPEIKKKSKEHYGFENDDFIYASFCQPIKITRNQFNIWIEILIKSPNSKLWLLDSNNLYKENLYKNALNKGVSNDRIVFAPKVIFNEHIMRHTIIDLFLDTFPYNSHTAASDALWGECPILTMTGDTFASRVGGSLLTEIGCPELITESQVKYLDKAIDLFSNPKKLRIIKEKIIRGKRDSAIFKFCKNLENIYMRLVSS